MEETGASSSTTQGHSVSAPKEGEAADKQSYRVVQSEFNLKTGDYTDFICKFRTELAEYRDREVIRGGRAVLTKQDRPKMPRRWMHVKLVGNEGETTTLAIRDDNLYLIGFQAKNKRWYQFGFKPCKLKCDRHNNKAQCEAAPHSVPMMKQDPAPTFLECDVNYSDLLEVYISKGRNIRIREEMVSLELGKTAAIEAVGILSGYDEADGVVVNTKTRRALVRLILMFCEATRMIPFFNTVVGSWEDEDTSVSHGIRMDQAIYIWNWGNMSAALKEWKIKHYKSWGPTDPPARRKAQITQTLAKDDIGIKSAADALGVVQLLLNKRDPFVVAQDKAAKNNAEEIIKGKGHAQATGVKRSRASGNKETRDDNMPSEGRVTFTVAMIGFGRPLVEVFSVRADPAILGSISVFDGKRGQVIYTHHGSPIHGSPSQGKGKTDLALTGPFRAISANGSFTIQVKSIVDADKGENNVGGDMFRDCYSNDVVYDQVANQDVSIGNTGSIVNVTYAVLSHAVEATVKIQLVLPFEGEIPAAATTLVHGKITVQNELFGDKGILLFSRVQEEEMEVEVESHGGCMAVFPVPLARSVIAAPLDFPLSLSIDLHAAYPPNRKTIVSFNGDMYIPHLDQYTGEIESNGVALQPMDTTPPNISSDSRKSTSSPSFRRISKELFPPGDQRDAEKK